METTDGPAAISIKPSTIKAAQEEMGRLDVLVCGQCHSVFHFIEDFQEHRSKEGACSKQSNFRESSNNEQKAQVWAFLLWKDTQIQQDSPDKDTASSWKLYKKWCNMENHVRDCWIAAGKTIQTFTKISNTKMTDVPRQRGTITTEGGRTLFVHKVIRNGQPDSPNRKEIKPDIKLKTEPIDRSKVKLRPSIKPKTKSEFGENNAEDSNEEYVVEKILAKRFNPKKKVYEYLLKWEGYAHEHNTWEEVENVSVTCKQLMDEFEKNLAKQKELKALHVQKSVEKTNQMGVGHKIIKKEPVKPGPSTSSPRRPMRTSKSKAMDNVKNWVDVMKGEEDRNTTTALGKRKIPFSDSDSDDGDLAGLSSTKRSKADTSGDDDWTADSEDDKAGVGVGGGGGGSGGRSDVIQKAFSRAQNGSQPAANSVFAKTVKSEGKAQSTVYLVHRKDGVIRLDHTPTDSIAIKSSQLGGGSGVLMVQNRDGSLVQRKQLASNSITCEKVVSKPDGTQVVTQMKVLPKGSPAGKTLVAAKGEPVRIKPRPSGEANQLQQIQLITAAGGQKVVTAVRTSSGASASPRLSADGGRPLLPRPAGMRIATSTPTATSMTVTPTQNARQRQLLQQQQQQQQQRKKPGTTTTTLVQVATPTSALPSVRPKITVVNAQGPLMQKIVSPAGAKPSPKSVAPSSIVSRPLPSLTTQQKIQAAKKKAEQEAGVVSKPAARGGNVAASRAAAARGKPKVTVAAAGNKPKESKLAVTGGLHMEFHQVESEDSSDGEAEFPPMPAGPAQPAATEPESPPRLTLCPLTGRIIGPDGEPVEQPPQQPEVAEQVATSSGAQAVPVAIVPAATTATIGADGTIVTSVTTAGDSAAELVLPTMEGLTDSSGAVMRVEMSPGGTTGMIVQSNESAPVTLSNVVVPGPDLPCLDDPNIEVQTTSSGGVVVNVSTAAEVAASLPSSTAAESAASVVTTTTEASTSQQPMEVDASAGSVLTASAGQNVKLEEAAAAGQLVTLTGEDGVVYQVAGQAENGQTLLVAQGADGEQQCVYVTTADAGQGEEGQVLTLDHAVAEAVAQLMPDQVNLSQQYYVKDGEATAQAGEATTSADGQVVMMDNSGTVAAAQEDGDAQAQVVAQVIQADPPTEDGRRRVVLLLPDGNLMMTEVDEEQYAALELDK